MRMSSMTALLAGLAIVAGCGGGSSGSAMDAAFIADMTAHHQGAIQMARIAQERAEHPELRELAGEILSAQAREVAVLKRLREAVHAAGDEMGATHDDMGMDSDPAALATAEPFDQAFIDVMIPHHEDAVAMSQRLLDAGPGSELRELAEGIIDAQTEEIERMREWREAWY